MSTTVYPNNLYRVSRSKNDHIDYDEFSSFVIAAPCEATARRTHPRGDEGYTKWSKDMDLWVDVNGEPTMYHSWTSDIDSLRLEKIGTAEPGVSGVIIASFHAG